ncbi:hypothetical protein BHM04_01465 [Macrococcus sp. IME1552]|nr:hypothetical protein BHM04_01465 [Macrococcus sp. IME1552]
MSNEQVYRKLMNIFLIFGFINFINLIYVKNDNLKLFITLFILFICIVAGYLAWFYVRKHNNIN